MIHPQHNPDFIPEDIEFDEEDYIEEEHLPPEVSRVHSDDELEIVLKELLHNSSRVDSRDLTINVDKTNVTLTGTVKSQQQKDLATEIVKLVHGVGNVDNNLKIE